MQQYTQFQLGRLHQLIVDRSKSVPASHDRRITMARYIEELTQEQKIAEALEMITEGKLRNQKRKKQYNEYLDMNLDLFKGYENEFYLGRCVQFILDSNNKVSAIELSLKSSVEILTLAHDMKERMLDSHNDCVDCDCDECGMWSRDDKRCWCGNKRYWWVQTTYDISLDTLYVDGYADTY